jgi:hypothetical protein
VDYSKSFFKKLKLFLKEKNFNLKVFKLNFSKYIKRQLKRNNSLEFVSFLKSVCTDNKEYSEKLNSLIRASNLEGKKKIITKKFFLILNKNLKI